MHRKPFPVSLLVAIAAAVLVDAPVGNAQAPEPMSARLLKDNIYWVEGGAGANAGFRVGPGGVVVIDAKMTPDAAREMLAKIKELTPQPVTTVLLTHSDGDHVNGLAGFPPGLTIVASEGCRREMAAAFEDEKLAHLRPYLPTTVFTDSTELPLEGAAVRLHAFGPAHTGGDAVVLFPAERVAFIGDLAFVGRDPLIHRSKGGTSFGLAKTLKSILALEADTFISGHSQPLAKSDIEELCRTIEVKQAKVKDLIAQGKSLDEVRAAFGIAAEPEPPAGRRRWPSLVEVIFLELTEQK